MILTVKRFLNKNKPPIKVYWWRSQDKPNDRNFGDEITSVIVKKLWNLDCELADPKTCDMIGAGSIIERAQHQAGDNPIKVWGSGFIQEGPPNDRDNLDFYAVRGRLSLARIKAPRHVALGDPGMLTNLAVKRAPYATYKVGVLYHYVDANHPSLKIIRDNPRYKLISPLQAPEKVAQDITSCELVLSSSLHGLIVADSYKVPNYWMPMSDKLTGGDYKFRDHYSATNRELIKRPTAILGNDKMVDDAIRSYRPVKNLRKLQRDLIKSFPY